MKKVETLSSDFTFVIFRKIRNVILLQVLFLCSTTLPAESRSLYPDAEDTAIADTTRKRTGNPVQPVYTASRLTGTRPLIDGKLDDDCWKTGIWGGNFTQFIPNEGAKPSFPTEFKILYDNKNLYVALRGYDYEPEKIQRHSGLRDELEGDVMGVNFDSYHDHRTGFEFSVTAWGQKVDLILFNPMAWDINWNAVWRVKTGLEDSAWVAEYEIPFSQLRYSRENDQVWGMHVWRWINRFQEESDWEIQSQTGPGMLFNFGELHGISGLKSSRRLEIQPYSSGFLKTDIKEAGNPFNQNGRTVNGNVGLDAKVGISSNFTIDLTVNPDFGQVESDPSVMNLSAFETFYDEKRPFFQEGVTIFDYSFDDQSLFYSRRIGHAPSLVLDPGEGYHVNAPEQTSILSAVKLSGTTANDLSVGLIQSVTGNEFAQLSDTTGEITRKNIEPLSNYMIARIRKGYHEGNTVVGGILTSVNRFGGADSPDFLSDNAYTGGLDILHHWKDKSFFIDARLIGSMINGNPGSIKRLQESSTRYYQRPGADYLDYDTTVQTLSGFGGKFMIGKGAGGSWRYSAGATWFSPGLELNDLGYLNRADEINQVNEVSYLIIHPVGVFRSYDLSLEQFNTLNFNGDYLGSGINFSFHSELKNLWHFSTHVNYYTKSIDTRILRGGYAMKMPSSLNFRASLNTDPSKKIVAGITDRHIICANHSATTHQVQPYLTVRPLNILKVGISADYADNTDNLQYITSTNYASADRYILGRIDQKTLGLTMRLDFNITPEFSVQYYGSPFISKGSYSAFKRVTDPEANTYGDRFTLFDEVQRSGDLYDLDENGDGIADYSISNPDFNFSQFRSNLVLKWEYRLGSFVYFIWSSDRTGSYGDPAKSFTGSYKRLFNIYPGNIFLVKLSYWFSV